MDSFHCKGLQRPGRAVFEALELEVEEVRSGLGLADQHEVRIATGSLNPSGGTILSV
jgi:hypothetical protein